MSLRKHSSTKAPTSTQIILYALGDKGAGGGGFTARRENSQQVRLNAKGDHKKLKKKKPKNF